MKSTDLKRINKDSLEIDSKVTSRKYKTFLLTKEILSILIF